MPGTARPMAWGFLSIGRHPRCFVDTVPMELFELHSFEIAARNDPQDPSILGYWNMSEASITHRFQRVDSAALRHNGDGVRRHRLRQMGRGGIVAFGQ